MSCEWRGEKSGCDTKWHLLAPSCPPRGGDKSLSARSCSPERWMWRGGRGLGVSYRLRSTCAGWQGIPKMMALQSGTSGMTGLWCGMLGMTGFRHRTPGVLDLLRGAGSPVWNP